LLLKQFDSLSEYISIVFFEEHFVLCEILFESKSFQNNLSSIDLSNTLLESFVCHVDLFEFILSWILDNVSSISHTCFETGFHYTRSSVFGIKGFNSFDSVFDFFNRRSLLFLLDSFKCFLFDKRDASSFTTISFQLNQHLLLCVQESFLFFLLNLNLV